MTRRPNTMEDFWRNVDVRGEDDCWEWRRARTKDGYGHFSMNGKLFRAHRLAISTVRDIPKGMHVCHKCDNPPCCNPRHLFLGSHADNMRDRDIKGRQFDRKGESHPKTRLLECEVHFIKHSDISNKRLGEIFEVASRSIWQIKTGRRWGHVK